MYKIIVKLTDIKLMYKVNFVVHDDSKSGSYPIRVVGNLPQLGNWNPANGFKMQEYDERQWESTQQLTIPIGQQFEFKLVKILGNNQVEWEHLPSNSNRKFKPKFNTKLILRWSSHIGQALNEAKSSMKLKGLPGVMIKGQKQGGLLKKNLKKKKKNLLSDSDTNSENENDSFCVGRKKSSDIRESMNSGDIEQIYYDTTELENAYHSFKQIQVFIISGRTDLDKHFQQKIDQQLKELHEVQNFKIKWLFLGDDQSGLSKFKKISFKKIEKSHHQKIYLEQYATKNVHRNYFIFVDLDAALRTVVGNSSACLYLPSHQFEKAIANLNYLQKYQLICFDSAEANRKLLHIFEEKRIQNEQTQTKLKKRQQRKSVNPKNEKNLGEINLQKILEELQLWQTQITINTVHAFTKNEAIVNILQPNSILFIDSEIMKSDKNFFYALMEESCEKRLIIIIHKIGVPEWIHNFSESKNVCIILDNFMKLYFLGKLYDPSQKHRNAIQFVQMRARLFEKQFGGSWEISQDSFTYKFKDGTMSKASNIKAQIENVLIKDYNYFKFHMKENKLKISWNLSHPVRLLRTLIRIKSIEEGQIGNFYIVTQSQHFGQLKQQIRLLINTNVFLMVNGKDTPIYDFGFGNTHSAKYSIKLEQVENADSRSSTSSTEIDIESSNLDSKKRKLQFLQKKCLQEQKEKLDALLPSTVKNEKLEGV